MVGRPPKSIKKSVSQICHDYRERKKATSRHFLASERERKRRSRARLAQQTKSEEEKEHDRLLNRQRVARFRARKAAEAAAAREEERAEEDEEVNVEPELQAPAVESDVPSASDGTPVLPGTRLRISRRLFERRGKGKGQDRAMRSSGLLVLSDSDDQGHNRQSILHSFDRQPSATATGAPASNNASSTPQTGALSARGICRKRGYSSMLHVQSSDTDSVLPPESDSSSTMGTPFLPPPNKKQKRTPRKARLHYRLGVARKANHVLNRRIWQLQKENKKLRENKKLGGKDPNNTVAVAIKTSTPLEISYEDFLQELAATDASETDVQPQNFSGDSDADPLDDKAVTPGPCSKNTDIRSDAILYRKMTANLKTLPAKDQRRILKAVLPPDQVKDMRAASKISKDTGIDRRTLISPPKGKKVGKAHFKKMRALIIQFLTRPDNSITLPGVKDTVTIKKVKHQKVVLTDFLHVLHEKFIAEYGFVSRSFFKKVRRDNPYIKPVWCNNQQVCLCKRHQNFALMIRGIPQVGLPALPDTVVKKMTAHELEQKLRSANLPAVVKYDSWQSIEEPYGTEGKTSKKLQIVEVHKNRCTFIQDMVADMAMLIAHVHRVYAQHNAIRELRHNLQPDECTVQMDFAENWVVSHFEEVQSKYYTNEAVTVHPAIVHWKKDDEMKHDSIVFVTDERRHDATAIFAFIKVLIRVVKNRHPQISTVHYVTDSPSSQYRNCSIFAIVAQHRELFDVTATWSYFEAGHGKGPCDGIGAVAKRTATYAVRRKKAVVNAADFTRVCNKAPGDVIYVNVPVRYIETSRKELVTIANIKSIPGTMKAHMVVPHPSSKTIFIRETSCFKSCCYNNKQWEFGCDGWLRRDLKSKHPSNQRIEDNARPYGAVGDSSIGREDPAPNNHIGETSAVSEECAPEIHVGEVSPVSLHPASDAPVVEAAPVSSQSAPKATRVETSGVSSTPDAPVVEAAPVSSHSAPDAPVLQASLVSTQSAPDTRVVLACHDTCVGDFVATVYDQKWYVAEVLEGPADADREFVLKFMSPAGRDDPTINFRWPTRDDILCVPAKDILIPINKPSALSTKGRRSLLFVITTEDHEQIVRAFESWLQE